MTATVFLYISGSLVIRWKIFFCTAARKCQLSGRHAKRKLAFSGREYKKIVYWPRPRKKNPSASPRPSITCNLRHPLFSWPSSVIYYPSLSLTLRVIQGLPYFWDTLYTHRNFRLGAYNIHTKFPVRIKFLGEFQGYDPRQSWLLP